MASEVLNINDIPITRLQSLLELIMLAPLVVIGKKNRGEESTR